MRPVQHADPLPPLPPRGHRGAAAKTRTGACDNRLTCYRGGMRRALSAVALLALACLLLRSARVGLAGDYVDPVGRLTAQDEALYSHSAIRMATAGNWLTPMFMGRY